MIMPWLQGGDKRRFFNNVSLIMVSAIACFGGMVGYQLGGVLGGLVGAALGLSSGCDFAVKGRYYRR